MGSSLPAHVLWISLCLCTIVPKGISASEHFLLPNPGNNMALSRVTGRVYVTTNDHLYQLNQTLGLEDSVITGPVTVGRCTNVNKILVVDDNQQQVLTCGVVHRGSCEFRAQANISNATSNEFTYISPVLPQASAVAFLMNLTENTYLVVGITYTGKGSRYPSHHCYNKADIKNNVITVRNIKYPPFLDFTFDRSEEKVELEDLRTNLEFVNGFQAGMKMYMLFNVNDSNPQLVQMDADNQRYGMTQSLYQVSLTVKGLEPSHLRLVSSALISLPGQPFHVATVFLHVDNDTQRKVDRTLLYIYKLGVFQDKTSANKLNLKRKGFPNKHTESLQPNEEAAVFVHPELVSISATNVRNWTVFILGTGNGQLIKLVMDNNMKVKSPKILFEAKEEMPFHRKVLFEPERDPHYLYLMTDKEVIRLKMADCARHHSCQDCVSAQEPSCGWCNLNNRCSFESECENAVTSGNWISISEGKDSCLTINIKPSTIDYLLKNTQLFTVTIQGKLPNSITTGGEANCTLSRNKEQLCQSSYLNGCSCNMSEDQYRLLQDPIIVEVSIQFSHFTFSNQVTLRNCYTIKTAQHNTPCSECHNAGCWWSAAKHNCTIGDSQNPDQQFCPQVVKESYSSEATQVDFLLNHSAALKDSNTNLSCNFDGTLKDGKWINNSAIRCNMPTFQEPRKMIAVNVVHTHHNNRFIDNPRNITVRSCKSQSESCIFCPSEKACEVSVIDSITPRRVSTLETRTLTISGTDLNIGAKAVLYIEDTSDASILTVNCNIESSKSVTCALPSTRKGVKKVCLLYDTEQYGNKCASHRSTTLEYISTIFITEIYPTVSWASGGRRITVNGQNLDAINTLQMQTNELKTPTDCSLYNSTTRICNSSSVQERNFLGNYTVSFLIGNHSIKEFNLEYQADPTFHDFKVIHDTNHVIIIVKKQKDYLNLRGEEILMHIVDKEDRSFECDVTDVLEDNIKCSSKHFNTSEYKIKVKIGNFEFLLEKKSSNYKLYFLSLIAIPIMLVIFIGVYCLASKRKAKQFSKTLDAQLELLESQYRNTIRAGFVELQTEGSDIHLIENCGSIPFLDYKHFALRTYFPSESGLAVKDLIVTAALLSDDHSKHEGFRALSDFLSNKQLLVILIHTLEQQKTFAIKDRCSFASLLSIAFHSQLVYLTSVLEILLTDLMEQAGAQSKLLLRGTETVVEKLLTNWVSICMYGYLRETVGESLYSLVSAIKQRINQGPVDAVTGKALYTLNEDWLLWQVTEFNTVKLNVFNLITSDGCDLDDSNLSVDVLDCDTIGQTKEKIFDAFMSKYGYSQKFHVKDIDLQLDKNETQQILKDIDDSSQVLENGMKKLNTVGHYKISDTAKVTVIKSAGCTTADSEDIDRHVHLISQEPNFTENSKQDQGKEKYKVKEMYLTKLLSSKVALHSFVERFLKSIWTLPNNKPPVAIKFLFDFLYAQAQSKKITDPDILHIWKTNSLPLRFWVNIIKNPQFVFDMEKTPHLDSCLSVIAQAFMDSFSLSSQKLGKHSPTNKVLYARDIPHYKEEVKTYFKQIAEAPALSKEELENFLIEESRKHENEFKEHVAMVEIGKYIRKYSVQLQNQLENEGIQKEKELSQILQYYEAKSMCGWS